jgi:hypothetical protein
MTIKTIQSFVEMLAEVYEQQAYSFLWSLEHHKPDVQVTSYHQNRCEECVTQIALVHYRIIPCIVAILICVLISIAGAVSMNSINQCLTDQRRDLDWKSTLIACLTADVVDLMFLVTSMKVFISAWWREQPSFLWRQSQCELYRSGFCLLYLHVALMYTYLTWFIVWAVAIDSTTSDSPKCLPPVYNFVLALCGLLWHIVRLVGFTAVLLHQL